MNRVDRLTRILRSRVILDTEQGGRIIGHRCDLCSVRWRGLKERHHVDCALDGSAPEQRK